MTCSSMSLPGRGHTWGLSTSIHTLAPTSLTVCFLPSSAPPLLLSSPPPLLLSSSPPLFSSFCAQKIFCSTLSFFLSLFLLTRGISTCGCNHLAVDAFPSISWLRNKDVGQHAVTLSSPGAAHFTVQCGRRIQGGEYRSPRIVVTFEFSAPRPGAQALLSHKQVSVLTHQTSHTW